MRMKRGNYIVILLLLAAGGSVWWIIRSLSQPLDADLYAQYEYAASRSLVTYVEAAAAKVRLKGEDAFRDFADTKGPWMDLESDLYLFVYDTAGTCVFHAVQPELRGRNILDLKDINGKLLIRDIVDVGGDSATNSGWVHYFWAEPGAIFPLWKSSYIVRAVTPEGRTYCVGSGLYNMSIEKRFIQELVDRAATMLAAEGESGFQRLRDPADDYVILGAYVFVMDLEGRAIVDPAFPLLEGRNLSNLVDAEGKYVVREAIARLRHHDSCWGKIMWPRPGEVKPTKKLGYFRKVRVGDRWLIVGSNYYSPVPIWMSR